MPQLTKRRKAVVATILSVGATFFFLLCAEAFLKLFFPVPRPSTIGHVSAPNAILYGWGYHPGEVVWLYDPDSGDRIECRMNNHGWKDRDHDLENRSSAFRILILGDSVTFGAIVPTDQTYGYLLEKKMRSAGFNAEVISLGYGGWSTDQELEALLNEGVRYRPNLVLNQFCNNDIEENLRGPEEKTLIKPFFYTLDERGDLRRNVNPSFTYHEQDPLWGRNFFRELLYRSEIYKRIRMARSVNGFPLKIDHSPSYKITPQALGRMSAEIAPDRFSAFREGLKSIVGRETDRSSLEAVIKESHLESQSEDILRMCENRWFQDIWSIDAYRGTPPDPGSIGWRLYFRLIERLRDVAAMNGAPFVIFSETDLGSYEWSRFWMRVAPEEQARKNYLAQAKLIEGFTLQHGIGFVPQVRKYTRARNDPHANPAGNQAMADDIFDYLISSRRIELEKFKSPGTQDH